MAQKIKNENEAAGQQNLEATVSSVEQFFKNNGKKLWTAVAVIVVVGLAVLAYSKFIYQPKCEQAMQAAYPAELSFQQGEWEIALNGDGNVLGFADIINEYGTKAGKAVYLYAGICNLQLGQNEEALQFLGKYSGKDPILAARAEACKGDAYVGLGDYQKAVSCFEKAVATADNVFAAAYLLKAGVTYEALQQPQKAVACYEQIKDKYPQSIEAYDIERYINRIAE